jgi:hypothetical protein
MHKSAMFTEEYQHMQISRHWRLNAQRYRLEGFRTADGEVSLQNRPALPSTEQEAQNQPEPVVVGQLEDVTSTAA